MTQTLVEVLRLWEARRVCCSARFFWWHRVASRQRAEVSTSAALPQRGVECAVAAVHLEEGELEFSAWLGPAKGERRIEPLLRIELVPAMRC